MPVAPSRSTMTGRALLEQMVEGLAEGGSGVGPASSPVTRDDSCSRGIDSP